MDHMPLYKMLSIKPLEKNIGENLTKTFVWVSKNNIKNNL